MSLIIMKKNTHWKTKTTQSERWAGAATAVLPGEQQRALFLLLSTRTCSDQLDLCDLLDYSAPQPQNKLSVGVPLFLYAD